MLTALKRAVPTRFRPSEIWFRSVMRRFNARGVLTGPFQGLRWRQDFRPDILNHLLGIYERELHPAIAEVQTRVRPRTVIDLGAYYGYYAIGFARMFPASTVLAYEASAARQVDLRANIDTNGVTGRVAVRGEASATTLQQDIGAAQGPVLVVCDIDGPEIDVINLETCPALARAFLLVETHSDHITATLRDRLSCTHDVRHIPARPTTMADVPNRPWYLRTSHPDHWLKERSGEVGWLWARPH